MKAYKNIILNHFRLENTSNTTDKYHLSRLTVPTATRNFHSKLYITIITSSISVQIYFRPIKWLILFKSILIVTAVF